MWCSWILSALTGRKVLLADQKALLLQVEQGAGHGGLVLLADLAKLGGGHARLLVEVVQAGNVGTLQLIPRHGLGLDAADTAADGGDQQGKGLKTVVHIGFFSVRVLGRLVVKSTFSL